MPSFEKVQVITLACSRNRGGKCVAGVRADTFEWVRLVERDPAEEGITGFDVSMASQSRLYANRTTLADDSKLQLLDLIEVDLLRPKTATFQRENVYIGSERWLLIRRPVDPELLSVAVERLIDSSTSTIFGSMQPSVLYETILGEPRPTLRLVTPRSVTWFLQKPWNKPSLQARVRFYLGDYRYDLPITDPVTEAILLKQENMEITEHDLGLGERLSRYRDDLPTELAFTLSLGTPHEGRCYKLVAGVLVIPLTVSAAHGLAPSSATPADLARENHLEVVDDPVTGCWIIGGPALGSSIQAWAPDGSEFYFARFGATETQGRPAWGLRSKRERTF
jgi:hypothetical protein